MRLTKFVRCTALAASLSVAMLGAVSFASAQDATAEATVDPMMSEMMAMPGACPEGVAAKWFDQMSMMNDGGMEATDDADMGGMEATDDMDMSEATMEATHDMNDMDMATAEPGMEATDDMGMGEMKATCLVASVSGAEEVPGPGDDDGWGIAVVSIDPNAGQVCYDVMVGNITLPAAANHIHAGEAGVSGGVVVPFPTAPDADGKASGCTDIDMDLANSIIASPSSYYYNVHTSDFPDGAARGQFWTWDDAVSHMSDMGMDMSEWDMDHTGDDMGNGDMSATMEPNMDVTPMATEESSG